jgi:hypothetical protein
MTSSTAPFDVGAGLAGAWFSREKSGDPRVALFIFTAAGSARKQQDARSVFNPATNPPAPYTFDGRTLVVRGGFLGEGCVAPSTVHLLGAGQFDIDDTAISGPGCQTPSHADAARFTRLSPRSPASDSVWPPTPGPGQPVTDPVQLTGIWWEQGSAELLAFDDSSGSQYVIDGDGKIDSTPAHHGSLAITVTAGMTLSDMGPSCSGSTTLEHLTTEGTSPSATIQGSITTDPCQVFRGQSQITLRQVK